MKKIWDCISKLGIKENEDKLLQRSIKLTNQLNFVILIAMLLLFLTTFITLRLMHEDMSYGTLRIPVLMACCFLNLVLARFGLARLSRLSLIFLPPIVFLLGPTMIGYVEEESYTYYPYFVIAASIIPLLLLNPRKEKGLFFSSIGFYFFLTLFIDRIMMQFGTTHYPIIDRINTFYTFYKVAQISLFLIINVSIYILRSMNYQYEEELNLKNIELDRQNRELKEQKERIEKHEDELISKGINTWQKMVGIISHEIVNSAIPITNLAGMTGQMLEDESGAVLKPGRITEETAEDIHHSLKIIELRTQALINFVKATKSLTQIPKPSFRQVSVKDLFNRVTALYLVKSKESGVYFEKKTTPEDLVVYADLELVEQILINLIQNSLEASVNTAYPIISLLGSETDEGQVQISVSDNGPGISDDKLDSIFLPFYSTKINKSGIGLSLSQQIMLLHHGRLEVVPGRRDGATFILVF